MLILTRKLGESVIIDDDIKITILGTKGQDVKIGIEAPEDVKIQRDTGPQQPPNRFSYTWGSLRKGRLKRPFPRTGIQQNSAKSGAVQRAMAVATIYPDPESKGRGNKSTLNVDFSAQYISYARTIIKHAPDLSFCYKHMDE